MAFTNATTASLTTTYTTPNILWDCWDTNTPANAIFPANISLNTSTLVVTFTFAVPQSGFCAVNGGAGAAANGVTYPASCATSYAPPWCAGSDIGAWTNAAIGALPVVPGTSAHCGEVYITQGSYLQSTSIQQPRCVKLHGASAQGTRLTWQHSSGWAVVVADNNTALDNNYDYYGALEDLSLLGPGVSNTAGAVYIGGSDGATNSPSVAVDPATNQGDHFIVNRVRTFQVGSVNGFHVGVQFGTNAWSDTIFGSDISFSDTNVSLPGTMTSNNSGEDITINNSTIAHANGVGISLGTSVGAYGVNLNIMNTSLDFNASWQIQNGTASTQDVVSLSNVTIYAPDHWIQNYGPMNMYADYFSGGDNSGTLGYLIDNETSGAILVDTGGSFLNGGSGTLTNSSGQASIWYAPFISAGGIGSTVIYIDRFGNILNNSTTSNVLGTSLLNQKIANSFSGNSACVGSTKGITFGTPYTSQPIILVFDETTAGGIQLTARSTSGFTAACTGATDAFDWIAIGNPN